MSYSFAELVGQFDHPDFFFVQVGANDGVTDDDVREHILARKWKGILIEPLPDVFEKLKANYAGVEGLEFVNAAIADKVGSVKFFRHPKYPQCSGLGVRTKMQGRAAMEEIEVRATTFAEVLGSRIGERVDLLQIDTEGFDAEVLKLWPFNLVVPRVIRFENKHLDGVDVYAVDCLLDKHGYEYFDEGPDTIAYLNSVSS